MNLHSLTKSLGHSLYDAQFAGAAAKQAAQRGDVERARSWARSAAVSADDALVTMFMASSMQRTYGRHVSSRNDAPMSRVR